MIQERVSWPTDYLYRSSYRISPGLGGVVGLTLPMARMDHGLRPVYYLQCSDLGQVVNLSLSSLDKRLSGC